MARTKKAPAEPKVDEKKVLETARGPSASSMYSMARYTVHLPPDLIELLKDIAWEDRITLNSLVRDALEAHVSKLVKKRGEPYPKRQGELRRGKIT
jgi:hypothetical protein